MRYSTAGESKLLNAQPILIDCAHGQIALCHNGNIVNARELREELGIEATIGRELFRTRHRYRELKSELELIFFQADVDRSAPLQNLVFEGFEWADPSALPNYDFLQADEEFVTLLASSSIPLDAPS